MTNSNRRAPSRPMMLNHAQITELLDREREQATDNLLLYLIASMIVGIGIGMAVVYWWPK